MADRIINDSLISTWVSYAQIDFSGTGLTVTGSSTLTLVSGVIVNSSGNIKGGGYTFGNATSAGNGSTIDNGTFKIGRAHV